jgi:hypothetical protein
VRTRRRRRPLLHEDENPGSLGGGGGGTGVRRRGRIDEPASRRTRTGSELQVRTPCILMASNRWRKETLLTVNKKMREPTSLSKKSTHADLQLILLHPASIVVNVHTANVNL